MSEFDPTRRAMIKRAALAGAGALAAGYLVGVGKVANAQAQAKTPSQPEGPFYPVKDQIDKDADMTRVVGRNGVALGERVRLAGRVVDVSTGAPVAGALVEFWQACDSGKYNHPEDPNDAPLDPNFQYWAQVMTDARGGFSLLTIKPGAYPADSTWTRPPHIHIKIHKAGYPSLTTQIYFGGDPLNDQDQILRRLTPEQRALVEIDLRKDERTAELEGQWTAYISRFNQQGLMGQLPSQQATPELD